MPEQMLLGNITSLYDTYLQDILTKFLVAIGLSGALGFERERKNQGAGLRTHILVCLGATLLMTVALAIPGGGESRSRVAGGIITGIGFLGGGTIINYGRQPHGLTTAAMVWFVACLGVAVGLGSYLVATVSTVFALVVAVGFEHLGRTLLLREKFLIRICMPENSSPFSEIESFIRGLGHYRVNIIGANWSREKQQTELTLDVLAHSPHELEIITTGLREKYPHANSIKAHR